MFRLFGVESKKFGSMLKNTEKISFSKLYIKRSTRRGEFFKG
ncbi:MAG: hypothetical protein ACMUEL_00960 [Flavobacteriales bacterium Tduv]